MERREENTTEVIKSKPKNKRNKCLRKRQHSSDEEIKQDSDEDIRLVYYSFLQLYITI